MSHKTKTDSYRAATSGRFVTFSPAGVHVDLNRYLRSPEGRKAIKRVDEARKQFTKQKG
jgi:hypothetical protein